MRVRLKPADPFDLIRLLARSQNDPKKAVAELVQNSLDAIATEVTVTRYRRRGVVCLSVFDNGQGVLPEMDRPGALQHIATHIGHSTKSGITAEERYRLLQQGKYGIGLLGFWSVGRTLSIRSRVGGGDVYVLGLEEDKPTGTVSPERGQKALDPTWTEVVIRDLHPSAQRLLTGRRLAEYLAFELRGQIINRGVRLRVVDRMARGRAQKDFPVRPPRFQGVPFRSTREWPVEGHPPLRVDLYYLPEEHGEGRVTLACAGTTVADDIAALEAADLRYAPWDSGRLTGIIDAPFLDVAPGTRRGIIPNDKADAFVFAVRGLADRVAGWLAEFEEARAREADHALQRRLQQVFRDLRRRLPHYEMFPVQGGDGTAGADDPLAGEPAGEGEERSEDVPVPEDQGELYEPGPLEAIRIVPASCRLPLGAEKGLTARAEDGAGRIIRRPVAFSWRLLEGPGRLEGDGSANAVYHADDVGRARILAQAEEGKRRAEGEAGVEVLEEIAPPEREDVGIPEPVEVKDPEGRWRSRTREGRWEFNGSHPDYLFVAADPSRRFRYLATLLAKELALRQIAGGTGEDRILESLVEILAAIEDRLGRPVRK